MGNETNEMTSVVIINGVREEKTVYETTIGTNAETGEAIVEYQVQNGFDAMTGEPVYVTVEQDGFDPDNGKPVYVEKVDAVAVEPVIEVETAAKEETAAPVAEVTEPAEETADPIAENVEETAVPVVETADYSQNQDTNNYVEMPEVKKSKTGLFVAIAVIVAVLVVAAIGTFAAIKGGMFMNSRNKIALATANTLKESSLVEAMTAASAITAENELTSVVEGSVSASGVNVDVQVTAAQDVKAGKIGAEGKVDIAGITEQTVKFYYDDKKIQFAAPDIYDDVFEYNYSSGSDGYLAEIVEDETDGSIDDVNTILKAMNKIYKGSDKYRTKLAAEMVKAYSDIEVEKIGSEKYEIDGKDRKCKGYTVTITEDAVSSVIKAYSKATDDVYGDTIKEMLEAVSSLTGEDMDYDDLMDEMTDEIDDFDEISFDIFIYKNKLAAIETKIDGSKLSVEFKGGDKRISEVEVSVDKQKITITDKDRKGKESITVEAGGMEIAECTYNKENGKLVVSAMGTGEYEALFLVEGGKKVTIGFDGNIEGVKIDMTAVTSKGAKIKELKGDVFDLADADEDDYEDLIEDISSELYSLMGMGGSSYDDYDDYDYDYDYDDYDYDNPFDF